VTELHTGDSGSAVLGLQIRLAELGFDPNGIDGRFGPGTARAVRAFQETHGLDVDGVVGDTTAAALGFDPHAEVPSGFPGVSITAVAQMFSPHTPLKNIREHLPNVLGGLLDAQLRDQKMVLMALATIRAETEGFKPVSELPSKFNTADGGPPFGLYDNRGDGDLGNHGPPDGERFRGRGFIQLTGRFNYGKFGRLMRLDLIGNPELANDSRTASKLLAAFLKDKETKIRSALARDDLAKARKLVNGGKHGLEQFTDAFQKGQALLSEDLILTAG
jgi:peptidoglycan L-alanyl-D-glutamate endopeptidase CwlK